jgi:hypothetical protein
VKTRQPLWQLVAVSPHAANKVTLEFQNNKRVTLHPNPAAGKVFVHINRKFDEGTLQLYDLQGRALRTLIIDGKTQEFEIDLTELTPGLYFTRIVLDRIVYTRKLVVEKE